VTHVDVLVVNYGTGDLVRRGVELVKGPGVHLWVYDNSGELLAEPPVVDGLLGDGSNHYFAAANNALYDCCDAPYVLLLNPDVELVFEDLLRLATALEDRPGAWGVAPRLLEADGSDQHYLYALPTVRALLADRLPLLGRVFRRSYARYVQADVDLRRSQVVIQPPAACLLVRRSVLGPTLFDEQYRLFFNDTDLARRLNVTHECWYAADVTARHLRGASFARLPRGHDTAREYDRTLLRYARNNLRGWWLLLPVLAARRFGYRLAVAAARRSPAS
jgi:N-acetylglucosaminyl-diphospho-decaprenol L-rhamnosyltransferase